MSSGPDVESPNVDSPDVESPNVESLAQRRQRLKARRKIKFYKMAWRTLAMAALAAGTVKVATSPVWLIRSQQQIEVSNNQLLSADSVRTLLPIPYPQSLVSIQPEELISALSAHAPIEDAAVRRKLIPPRLQVQLTEKVPVAIALPNTQQPLKTLPEDPIPFEEPGLIDAEGYWMPRSSFSELGAEVDPPLQVLGIRAEDVTGWRKLYKAVARSPVDITVVDWSNQENLILHSEMGRVHIGPLTGQLTAQLTALDQLRSLDEHTPSDQISFINLQDPDNPIVEVLQASEPQVSEDQAINQAINIRPQQPTF